ncbi:MAG TPA: tyrosine-type recombinase/integrase [Variovorax sp.]
MTKKTNDKRDKIPALKARFTQKWVDTLTYADALKLQHSLPGQPCPRDDAKTDRGERVHDDADGQEDRAAAPALADAQDGDAKDGDTGACNSEAGDVHAADDPSTPPAPESVRVWDTVQRGFGMRLSRNGTRQYFVVGRVRGSGAKRSDGKHSDTQRYISLGQPSVARTLKEARDDAARRLQELRDGTDCSATAQRAKAAEVAAEEARLKASPAGRAFTITLNEVYEDFSKTNCGTGEPRRPRTLADYVYTLRYYLHTIAEQPVATITKNVCQSIFQAISDGKFVPPATLSNCPMRRRFASNGEGAHTAANATMRMLSALLEYAREQFQEADGSCPILGMNPVTAMHRITRPHRQVARTGRVPAERRKAFWQALQLQSARGRTEASRTTADWLCFRLLSGIRKTESSKLCWGYVDFALERIVLPSELTKNHEVQVLPMNAPLIALLEHRLALYLRAHPHNAAPPPDHWVFDSQRSESGHVSACSRSLKQFSSVVGEGAHIAGHDIRRTFIDIATECHIDILERQRLLNHKGGVLQTNYANGDAALIEPMQLIGAHFPAFDAGDELDPRVAKLKMGWSEERSGPAATIGAWHALSTWDLTQLVWDRPTVQIAREYGLTDGAVGQRCKKLGIPKPGRGYWQKLAQGSIAKMAPPQLAQPPRSTLHPDFNKPPRPPVD